MHISLRAAPGGFHVWLASLVLLSGCALTDTRGAAGPGNAVGMFVVLGEHGAPQARVLTATDHCPDIMFDGVTLAMDLRAPAQTFPARAPRSGKGDAGPSAFPVSVCEKAVPAGTVSALVDGVALPLPSARIDRIVVIGDTGCRMKGADKAFQACNDADLYPFEKIAAAAARWKPDLVVHVGDYLYRETACPEGDPGCAGSPWGYGMDAWRADFFQPAGALLRAAPWVMVRGNHESCARAGQGWWRFMDPRPLLAGRDCNDAGDDATGDFSDPYAVPLGGDTQIVVLDSAATANEPIPPGDIREEKYRDMYRKFEILSRSSAHNIGVNHHPVLGFSARRKADGKVTMLPGNLGLQSVFGTLNPLLLPARVDAMLSGHVHAWQSVSFCSAHPAQFVAGFSGTLEDTVPLPAELPPGATPAPGAVVARLSSWIGGFGFMTMERTGPSRWEVKVWNATGQALNTCQLIGRESICDANQVR